MTYDANSKPKKVVLKLFELLEKRDQSFTLLFTEDAIFHTTAERKLRIEGLLDNFIHDLSAFPDYHYQINRVIAEGNTVVVDYNWSGTQEKEYWGVPSQGNRVDVPFTDTFDLEDGKIKKWRCLFNWERMHRQMTGEPVFTE